MVSARSAWTLYRVTSRSGAATSGARGFCAFGAGPRRFGVRPKSSPRSRCARQVVTFDEYNPPPAEQGTELRRLPARLRLAQDLELVLGREPPPGGLGQHLHIVDNGSRDHHAM